MKKLYMNMSVIRTILNKVAQNIELTEDEQFILQAFYGKVEDKDYIDPSYRDKDLPSEDENIYWDEADAYRDEWAMYANYQNEAKSLNKVMMMKAYKGRNHTTKAHLRDKSKHGYHNGAKKHVIGCDGRHDWLEDMAREKKARAEKQVIKSQMMSLTDEAFTFNADEVKKELMMVFNMNINGMKMVYSYHNLCDFALLGWWNWKIRMWVKHVMKLTPSEGAVYQYMDTFYPEMSMSDKKFIVEDFLGSWKIDIIQEASAMWRYCKKSYKSHYEAVQHSLKLAYDELNYLEQYIKTANAEKLTGLTGRFDVILSKIQARKMELEEMDQQNAKFF